MTATANDLLIGPVVVAVGVSSIAVDFLVENESWLEVYKSGSETPLILNTDYTFTGENTYSGTVTLTVPADGVDSYSVYLIQPKERSSDLQFRGDFRSGPINLELDRVWRSIQGLGTALNRTLRISKVSNIPDPLDTETAGERANLTLAFSADGTQLVTGPSAATIEAATAAAAASVTAADGSATAAAASATAADGSATSAAASAATALGTLLNYTGAWITATAYVVNDLVTESGSTYICVVAHTSGTFATDLGAGDWEVLAAKGTAGAGTGDLISANNLSDVASAPAARSNLGLIIGTHVQAYSTALVSWIAKAIPSGVVVGTTDTQTLTNKTLTSPALNTPTIATATFTGAITEDTGTMPAGTTPDIDPANGTVQEWTLTGNSTPVDTLLDGEFVELLIQDGTAYTITWPTITWLTDAGAAPTLGLTTVTPVVLQKVGSALYGRRTGDGG